MIGISRWILLRGRSVFCCLTIKEEYLLTHAAFGGTFVVAGRGLMCGAAQTQKQMQKPHSSGFSFTAHQGALAGCKQSQGVWVLQKLKF